jgi:hypothetical protein
VGKLEILKPGTFTDMKGRTVQFTEAMLREVAGSYNPAVHEAPLVLGHPRHDAPAMGWAGSLAFADGRLLADPKDVDPALKDLVERKRFKHLSASLYSPAAQGNPTPGKWYLRHIGFLGAQPPAVKGLAPVSLAEDEEGVVSLGCCGDQVVARLLRGIREFFIAKFGPDDADQALPSWDLEQLDREANQPEPESCPAFSEENVNAEEAARQKAELDRKEADLTAREAGLKAREQALEAQETQAQTEAANAFAETLVQTGRLLPVEKAPIVALLLPGDGRIELGEGQEPQERSSWLRSFLEGLPRRVELGEAAPEREEQPVDFAAPEGLTVDPQRMELHAKVVAHQKANPGMDYVTAARAVGV